MAYKKKFAISDEAPTRQELLSHMQEDSRPAAFQHALALAEINDMYEPDHNAFTIKGSYRYGQDLVVEVNTRKPFFEGRERMLELLDQHAQKQRDSAERADGCYHFVLTRANLAKAITRFAEETQVISAQQPKTLVYNVQRAPQIVQELLSYKDGTLHLKHTAERCSAMLKAIASQEVLGEQHVSKFTLICGDGKRTVGDRIPPDNKYFNCRVPPKLRTLLQDTLAMTSDVHGYTIDMNKDAISLANALNDYIEELSGAKNTAVQREYQAQLRKTGLSR